MFTRREFVGRGSAGVLTFVVAGCERRTMTPAAARDAGLDYRVLTDAEAATLDALGELFVPGAREAGLSHYLDQQFAADPAEQMLMLRYLGGTPPYVDFYRAGLTALGETLAARDLAAVPDLDTETALTLARQIASGAIDDWRGPPPGFWYFVLRSDAIDVVYGTREGFSRLGVPYMAHIEPPEPEWRGG
ncbi:MAG: gluconate 2-dehydrogenase subunit 3 family protein [Pseudomonadota bacterium]